VATLNSNSSNSNPRDAVLLLAHGSPESVDDVPEFLMQVTGGRGLPPHVVEEIKHRYGLIGRSPLTDITRKQAESLASALQLPVYVGMRNWKPFIADTVQTMMADGVGRTIVICLAPQNSRTSVGLYRAAVMKNEPTFTVDFVESWHDHPELIKAFAEKLGIARAKPGMQNAPVIFTAHSVPAKTIEAGDPYDKQAKETAALVAAVVGLQPQQWRFAFQSQGASGGPWIGPTVEETILQWKREGHEKVLLQPVGFLADHVEVLYDIDVVFKDFAKQQGMELQRTGSLNGSPFLIAALADIASSRLT
jgi:protoporphyrin/coproporphyrin ferrochelatase